MFPAGPGMWVLSQDKTKVDFFHPMLYLWLVTWGLN